MSLRRGWLRIFLDQCLVSLLTVTVAALIAGSQQAASIAAGSLLMTFNLGLLAWTWTRVFEKKSIALAGLIIVIKYAFFVAILFWITQQSWIQGLWLMAGIITFVPTTLLFAWRKET